jgi:tetratricopeptide (TPR) repeat protein
MMEAKSLPTRSPRQEESQALHAANSATDSGGERSDVDVLFEHGMALCQNGRFSEAESTLRRILKIEPGHCDTLHFLGMVCSQLGNHAEALRHIDAALQINAEASVVHSSRGNVLAALKRLDEALASFDRAIALDPHSAMVFSNRGNAQLELGQFEEAVASYDRAIALDPDDAEACYGCGSALQQLGRLEEALAGYDRAIAIRPDYAEAFNNRGVALHDLKRFDEAVASYDRAIAIRPDFPEAFNNRGNAFRELFLLQEAMASYEQAITLRSDFAEAWSNRGAALQELKRLDEAMASYDKAIAIRPDYAEAFDKRGNTLVRLGRFEDALANYDKAIAFKPDYAEAFSNRGNALRKLRRFDEELASYDKAIALKPDFAEAFNNRGSALGELKRFDEALASYGQAIALDPDYADAYTNRALLNLLLGKYRAGWEENQWRWSKRELPGPPLNVVAATWRGEDLNGRSIFVPTEQGLGDVIQFARYLPLLAQRKANVTFFVPSRLIRLLRPLTVGMRVVPGLADREAFDFQCALMDLPLPLNTDLPSIPADVPYLSAEDDSIARWRQRIGTEGFKIGIAWQGNPYAAIDEGRSIPLEQFAPLSRVEGVRLISLQKHHGLDQLARLPPDTKIETLGDDFDNGPDAFLDTAAVMASLDLIITSDTAIAHLAGALGRPTWVALKYVPDWRWLLDRNDSPWYPTLRLFRQPERENWKAVFTEIEQNLHKLVTAASSRETLALPNPTVPISWGEFIDKITILEIKQKRLESSEAVDHVRRELTALMSAAQHVDLNDAHLGRLTAELRLVNDTLWDIEDRIRGKEAEQSFDPVFIELARSVYIHNDKRADLKRRINLLMKSSIVEEKQYTSYG